MPISTDPTTPIGKVRLLIADTDPVNFAFEDAEVQAFLDMEDDNLRVAAAGLIVTLTADRAKLAKVVQLGRYQTQQQAVSDLLRIAEQLREDAISQGGLQTGDLELSDENYESFRPSWRGVNDLPVVE